MKFIRSTKCSLKYATKHKLDDLSLILKEYSSLVNLFINYFWVNPNLTKWDLYKPIISLSRDKWGSARLKKEAAMEALGMVKAAKNKNKVKVVMPTHYGKMMRVSSGIAQLTPSKDMPQYDAWLNLRCIGDKKMNMNLPIKFHKHFNKLASLGKRLNSYIITKDSIQFCFEISVENKRPGTKCIGIDTGINMLASLNNGNQYGDDIKGCIERILNCEHGSNGQKTACRALRQRMDEIAIEVIAKENPDLIVVEGLKNMGKDSRVKHLLTKSIRCLIGSWNWKYWMGRIEAQCELNRVSFSTVDPRNTSRI